MRIIQSPRANAKQHQKLHILGVVYASETPNDDALIMRRDKIVMDSHQLKLNAAVQNNKEQT